jgi:hypothetical protein
MQVFPTKRVTLQESDSEYLLYIHASLKERAKKIKPHVWNGTRRCWAYPHSPQVYQEIKAEFGRELVDETSQYPAPDTHDATSLTVEIAILRAENAGNLRLLTALRSENAELQSKADEADARAQALNAKFAQLQTSSAAERLAVMEQQLAEKDGSLRDLQVDFNKLQMQVVELKEQMEEKDHILGNLRRETAELKRKLGLRTKKGMVDKMQPYLDSLPFSEVECLVIKLLVVMGLDTAFATTVRTYGDGVLLSGIWSYRRATPCDVLVRITRQASCLEVDAFQQMLSGNRTAKQIIVVAPRDLLPNTAERLAIGGGVKVSYIDRTKLLKLFLGYGIGCRRDERNIMVFDQNSWLNDIRSAKVAYSNLRPAEAAVPAQAANLRSKVSGIVAIDQTIQGQLPTRKHEVRRNAADLLDTACEDADHGVVLGSSWLGKDEQGRMSRRDWSDSFDDFDSQDWEEHFYTPEYDTE